MSLPWRKKHSPVFTKAEKPRHNKKTVSWWRRGFLVLGIILVLAGFLYLVIWSPVLKIRNWSVESRGFGAVAQARNITETFLEAKFWKIIPRDTYFTFCNQELIKRLLADCPEAASVKIQKNIFKKEVKIIITGRQPAAICCQSEAGPPVGDSEATSTEAVDIFPKIEQCFFADETGLIFREAPAISGTRLPTFFNHASQNFKLGNVAIASSTIEFTSQLRKKLLESGIDSLGFMVGAADGSDLTAFTNEGWLIYFSLERSVQSQIGVLTALLEDEIKEKRSKLQYIDLRLASKVYYK